MASSNTTSSGTSSFSQLITRILLNQLLSPDEPTTSRTSAQPNIRHSIIELCQQYNHSINEYNANMAQYNRNIDRIIRLLEHEIGISGNSTSTQHANTYAPQTTVPSSRLPYTTTARIPNIRMDISNNILLEGSNGVTDISGSNTHISNETPSLTASRFTNYISRPTYIQRRPSSIQTYNNIINSFMTLQTPGRYLGRYTDRTEGLTELQIQNATVDVVFDASNNSLSYLDNTSRENRPNSLFAVPTQCPISLDEFTHGEQLLQIRECNHVFKPVELRRWLSKHSKCPVCRCNVTMNGMYSNSTPSNENTESDDMPDLVENTDNTTDNTNTTTNRLFQNYSLFNNIPYNYLDEEEDDTIGTIYQMEFFIRPPDTTDEETKTD